MHAAIRVAPCSLQLQKSPNSNKDPEDPAQPNQIIKNFFHISLSQMAYFRPLTFFLYWFLNYEIVHVYKNIMESGERWIASLGLADANYYIENG